MAQKSQKRRSRKARRAGSGPSRVGGGGQPRAVPSTRREQRAQRVGAPARETIASNRMLGTLGERPKGLFGDLPISETAILIGIVGIVVGIVDSGGPALLAGVGICALAVLEVTVREHFSGFRSHSTLLAAVPSLIIETLIVSFIGVPSVPLLLFLPVIPVFALSFYLLRRAFQSARQMRLARPPAA